MRAIQFKYLRYLGASEGLSLLILLFVAMSTKMLLDRGEIVSIIGTIHGLLFLMYLYSCISIGMETNIGLKKIAGAILAASLPFGFLFTEKSLIGPELKNAID